MKSKVDSEDGHKEEPLGKKKKNKKKNKQQTRVQEPEIEGDEVQIAFNVRYVLDGLKAMDGDRIVLSCNAPTTPAILSPEDDGSGLTYLVMPVQIRS